MESLPQEGEKDAGKVLVKVDENGQVYVMDPADVTAEEKKEPEVKQPRLVLLGSAENRAKAEVKVLGELAKMLGIDARKEATEMKFASLPVGWEAKFVLVEGNSVGKLVGAKGATMKKIRQSTGCLLEYLGKKGEKGSDQLALAVGPSVGAEMAKFVITHLASQQQDIQSSLTEQEEACLTRLQVPEGAKGSILGKARANLNTLEAKLEVMVFILVGEAAQASQPGSPAKEETKEEAKPLAVGDRVVAVYNSKDYPGVVEELPEEGENAGKVMVKVDLMMPIMMIMMMTVMMMMMPIMMIMMMTVMMMMMMMNPILVTVHFVQFIV